MPDEPRVAHKREASGGVYIGRPTKWGNPYKIGRDGTREEVIEKYREWITDPMQVELRADARRELRGKVLVCWCAPLSCHGDVLLEIANSADPAGRGE
jgi:hypothetical protein